MKIEVIEETIEDYSKRMSSKLLDLDLQEQLGNIATFKDILIRQQEARKTLIHLLLKSRCQFGSNQAAKEFLELKELSERLQKRKQILTDALQLEGLDSVIDNTDRSAEIAKLPELSWYNDNDNGNDNGNDNDDKEDQNGNDNGNDDKEDQNGNGPNKKARVEGVNDNA